MKHTLDDKGITEAILIRLNISSILVYHVKTGFKTMFNLAGGKKTKKDT